MKYAHKANTNWAHSNEPGTRALTISLIPPPTARAQLQSSATAPTAETAMGPVNHMDVVLFCSLLDRSSATMLITLRTKHSYLRLVHISPASPILFATGANFPPHHAFHLPCIDTRRCPFYHSIVHYTNCFLATHVSSTYLASPSTPATTHRVHTQSTLAVPVTCLTFTRRFKTSILVT